MAGSSILSISGSEAAPIRACHTCSISKSKCEPRQPSDDGKCQRCHRLNKECPPGRVVPRRVRRPRTNRTALLEEKLEGLVTLLTAAQNAASGSTSNSVSSHMMEAAPQTVSQNQQSIDPDPRKWNDTAIRPAESVSTQAQFLLQNNSLSNAPSMVPPASQLLPSSTSVPADDDRLQDFKMNMANHFPFVVIPPGMNAAELRSTRPHLYDSVIMISSYKDFPRQLKLRSQIVRNLTEEICLNGKKNIDLLQGLLVFIAWYHHYLGVSPQLTNMIQLATALVFDLGLHKPQGSGDFHDVFVEAMQSFSDRRIRTRKTPEEKRAYLGLFYLTNVISMNIGKIEPLQNTPYVADCCREIEGAQEYSSDTYLGFLVRLQFIASTANRSFPLHGVDYWGSLGTGPVWTLVKSLQGELDRFRKSLPVELEQSTLFQIHLSWISIHNFEICLSRNPAMQANHATSSTYPRLALLSSCLSSVADFFTNWLSLPASMYPQLPITTLSLVAHASVVLSMLNLFHFEGWDLAHAREVAPFSTIIEKLAQKYEDASGAVVSDGSDGGRRDVFCRVSVKLRRLIDWHDTIVAGRNDDPPTGRESTVGPVGDTLAGIEIDSFDDGFWTDIMAWTGYDEMV